MLLKLESTLFLIINLHFPIVNIPVILVILIWWSCQGKSTLVSSL